MFILKRPGLVGEDIGAGKDVQKALHFQLALSARGCLSGILGRQG